MEDWKKKKRGDGNEIYLRWDPRGFLPGNFEWQGEGQEIRSVEERILLDQIGSWPDSEIQDYWSAPEKLLDLGWILYKSMTLDEERYTPRPQSHFEEEQPNPPEESLILLEFHYHTIVQNLLYNIKQCRESLEKVRQLPDEELASRWRERCQEIEEACQGKTGEELVRILSNYKYEVQRMARQVEELEGGNRRWNAMITSAQVLLRREDRGEEEYAYLMLAFIRALHAVLKEERWWTQFTPGAYLEEMRNRILRWLEEDLSGETREEEQQRGIFRGMSVLSVSFPGLFWRMVQRAVDRLCAFLCQPELPGKEPSEEKPSGEETFLQKIDRIINDIPDNEKPQTLLDAYKTDGRRCVALLELDGKEQFIAFSGFWDVEDEEIRRYLAKQKSKQPASKQPANKQPAIEDNALAAFKRICEAFDVEQHKSNGKSIELVTFAYNPKTHYEIKQYIFYYAQDRHLRFQPVRNMKQDILQNVEVSHVKKDYACCERKLLAHLAATHRGAEHCSYLVVKFEPCVQCHAALERACWAQNWEYWGYQRYWAQEWATWRRWLRNREDWEDWKFWKRWEKRRHWVLQNGLGVLAKLTVEYPDRVV